MVNHYELHVFCWDIEHQLQENIINRNMKSWLSGEVCSIHRTLFTGSHCDIVKPYKLVTSQYLRYEDSLFLSYSFIYLFLPFAYRWIEWHNPPLIPFSNIINISISVNKSNFFKNLITSAFFKAACHANPGHERNFIGSKWYIFKHIFLKFSKTPGKSNISLLRYRLWYYLNLLFQTLCKLFLHAIGICNMHHIKVAKHSSFSENAVSLSFS